MCSACSSCPLADPKGQLAILAIARMFRWWELIWGKRRAVSWQACRAPLEKKETGNEQRVNSQVAAAPQTEPRLLRQMLTLPARLQETKPQVTTVLRQFLENTSILAKMRPSNDAKDFLGTLEYLGEAENCPEDVEIIMPACLGGGAHPAEWEGST